MRGGTTTATAEPTWQPHERHGCLTTQSDLPDTVFAFPGQRKEPLTEASHVRNAVARFDQVTGVCDADRAVAFANIEKVADYYRVDLSETDWRQLGVHPQPHREENARKGAETRKRTGEAEEAARKGAATRERLGIAEEAAKKAAAARREREEEEGRREGQRPGSLAAKELQVTYGTVQEP
jgi:hypothetical protein